MRTNLLEQALGRPLVLAVVLVSLSVCGIALAQSEGLKTGELLREIAPSVPRSHAPADLAWSPYRHGRVLDACTGFPVSGARIELWTEEIDANFGGFHRLGEVISGPDGRFGVRHEDGVHRAAGKVRITAPGYLARSTTFSDLSRSQSLFPVDPREPTPRVRVVDTFGRPIAGARITTTMTCAHDLPALEAHTAADGVAFLAGYGLQDDAPDLRVRADGYIALKYVDLTSRLYAAPDADPWTITLTRSQPFAVRAVRDSGEPRAHEAIYLHDSGSYQVERTDADGVARFGSRYGDESVVVEFLGGGESRFGGEVDPIYAADFLPTVRMTADDIPEDVERGRIRLVLPNTGLAGDEKIRTSAYHEIGWTSCVSRVTDEELHCPAGRVHLVVGGPFSGWEQQELDVEVAAGETRTCRIETAREPKIRINVDAVDATELPIFWVESGVGATRLDVPINEAFSVPDAPLVVGFGTQFRVVAKRLPAIHDGMVIELDAPAAPVEVAAEPVTQRVQFLSMPSGKPVVWRLADREGMLFDEATGTCTLSGSKGAKWRVYLDAEHHVAVYAQGRFGVGDELVVREVPSYAKLELPGRGKDFEVVGDDCLDFDKLAPGPLQLVLQWRDGRRKGLSVVLEPGDHRRITVTD